MLATVGDLVDDIVLCLIHQAEDATSEPGPLAIRLGADTDCVVSRRRGGSAANVAAVAAELGSPVRFIGCVGRDPIGQALAAELTTAGVDVVGRAGARTATVRSPRSWLVTPGKVSRFRPLGLT